MLSSLPVYSAASSSGSMASTNSASGAASSTNSAVQTLSSTLVFAPSPSEGQQPTASKSTIVVATPGNSGTSHGGSDGEDATPQGAMNPDTNAASRTSIIMSMVALALTAVLLVLQ